MNMKTAFSTQSNHYRRVFQIVAVLICLSVILTLWFVKSEWLTEKLIKAVVAEINGQGAMRIDVRRVCGNIADGISFDSLQLKHLSPPFLMSIDHADLHVVFSDIKRGNISINGKVSRIDIDGMISCSIASSSIPDYNGLACFAGLPSNFIVSSFSINILEFRPWQDMPFSVTCQPVEITSDNETKTVDERHVLVGLRADWRHRQIAGGDFSGSIRQRSNKVDGRLKLDFAGQNLITEVNLIEKRSGLEASGYISSASLDIANLSQWLVSTWQENFPFGFDGRINCSGSWIFKPQLGFLGNISGTCEKLRMVALGLFIPIVELNGNWKFFDGVLSFNDFGSRLFEFPASMSGQIDSVFENSRKWNVDFNCPAIDFADLVSGIPWGLKYSLNLPELKGNGDFSLQFRGSYPEIFAKMAVKELYAGTDDETRKIEGQIYYAFAGKTSGDLKMDMECGDFRLHMPLFERLKSYRGPLSANLPYSTRTMKLVYTLSGRDFSALQLDGVLMDDQQCLGNFSGKWRDGIGNPVFTLSSESEYKFSANHMQLIDFILAK